MEKVKLLSTFALFGATLASCSSNAGLSRVTYEKETDKCVTIAPMIKAFGEKQIKTIQVEDEDQYFYDLFGNGSSTTNVNLKITGGIKIHTRDLNINVPNADFSISDKITVEWNKDEDYIKIADSQTCAYIKSEGKGESKRYFKYINSPILGKIKYAIDDYVKALNEAQSEIYYGASFENLVMYEVAYSNCFMRKIYRSPLNSGRFRPDLIGISFDLSGFDDINFITPGLWFSDEENAKAIDEFTHAALSRRYTYKEDQSAVSFNLKFDKFDMKELEDLIEIESNEGNVPVIESSGTLNADYFVSFENNFIRQHEFIFDIKDGNVSYSMVLEQPEENAAVTPFDLSNINANGKISHNVVKDGCKIDSSFNPEEYFPIYW
ncbi:MAG: hypothetical protein MJ214_00795 [Bacilli bacterium]|nr:hypothetical protein [Bacilli bacterium]